MNADKSTGMPEMNSRKETGGTNATSRKPYQPPRLTIYGSIQKLTNATSRGTLGDFGPTGMNMRTCL